MMNISDMIIALAGTARTDKPVMVILHQRDENGCVISKTEFPVQAVFSHREDKATIYITESDGAVIDD